MYQKHLDAIVEAWNTGNLDLIDQIAAPNLVRTAPNSIQPPANGLSEVKTLMADFRKAYPDTRVTITESFFSENHGACKWNFKGTNTGPGTLPATGKKVDINGASILRFENNKLVREELYFDALEMLTQLGHLNLPKAASA